ncbi:MAG: PEP-CTERM sorting domain-containing protein [Verrucomicrobiota bacterium]
MITPALSRHSSVSSRRLLALAAAALALQLAPAGIAAATNGSAINTFVAGAFNWSAPGNWTGGTVADGTGAVATFSNNYTSTVTINFGLGGGSTNLTLGALNYTDTTPSAQLTLQGGSGGTATLTFDDVDGISEINVSTAAAVPLQFGNTGSLSIVGDDNLRISVTGTVNAVRLNTNVNWSGQTGKVTLVAGRYQTENSNTLPGAAELELGTGVQLRALLHNGSTIRNQSIKGLSGAATSLLGTSDNAASEATLTVGTGTLSTDSYDFAGILGGDIAVTGAGNENSRFSITKTGLSTQKFSGNTIYTGTTTINGGSILVNGTHYADTSLSNNLASVATRGLYTVNSGGTLGGTGTIKAYDTAGSGLIITVASGGTLAPGDGGIGTLTLDNTTSARSILGFSSGGVAAFDLGAGVTSDRIAILGRSSVASEVVFNSTVINFTDRTGGSLTTGDYLLFSGDSNVDFVTGYSGLTLGGAFSGTSHSGTAITGGLTVGTGLGSYASSQLFLVDNNIYLNVTATAVPEPSTYAALAGLAALGLAAHRRRRAK